MIPLFKKATLALALGAATLAVASPAQAQRYGGDYRGRGDGGTAVVAGLAGLAVGAAIASDRGGRGGYYDDRGYGYGGPVVYEEPYYRGYHGGYYQPRGYYRDYRHDYGHGRGYDGGRGGYRGYGYGR